jgi:hypothetical protein
MICRVFRVLAPTLVLHIVSVCARVKQWEENASPKYTVEEGWEFLKIAASEHGLAS